MWSADFDEDDKTKQPLGADTKDVNDDNDDGFDDWAEFEDGAAAATEAPADAPTVANATTTEDKSPDLSKADVSATTPA